MNTITTPTPPLTIRVNDENWTAIEALLEEYDELLCEAEDAAFEAWDDAQPDGNRTFRDWERAGRPDPRDTPPAGDFIMLENGLLHWPTRQLIPHSTSYFSNLEPLPYSWHPEPPEPETYMAWAMQVWPGDDGIERLQMFEEYLGYILQDRLNLQKALWLIGPTGAGKGIAQRLARALVGTASTCGPSMSSLATQFGGACLIGKRLAVIGDARLSNRADVGILTERLLSVIGGDLVELDRKGSTAWSGTCGVKFMFASNKIMKLEDLSGALAGRFMYLDFDQSFRAIADPGLEARIHAELPGILHRVLNALDRLLERGHFVEPPSVARDNALALNNPIAIFADEYLTVNPAGTASVKAVHAAFTEWSRDNGREHVPTAQALSAMLREHFPTLITKQYRDGAGTRQRFFVGFTVTQPSRDWHA